MKVQKEKCSSKKMQTLQGKKKPMYLNSIFSPVCFKTVLSPSTVLITQSTKETLHTGFFTFIWRHNWGANLKTKDIFFTSRMELPDSHYRCPYGYSSAAGISTAPAWHLDSVVIAWRTRGGGRYKLYVETQHQLALDCSHHHLRGAPDG